jgi:hypothetical protein
VVIIGEEVSEVKEGKDEESGPGLASKSNFDKAEENQVPRTKNPLGMTI